MIELGHLATIIALTLSLLALVFSVIGARWDAAFLQAARLALFATAGLLVLACATVIEAFLRHDFSVLYVAMNSNLRLPVMYRIAALWGGHEGSLLLWATILSLFGAGVVAIHWKKDPDFMPAVMGIFSAILLGFLTLVLFLSSPFERLVPAAADGRDLNPLLQDPQMALHPPTLFAGYTGFAVPYAFAMAVLLTRRGVDRWIFLARRWTLFAWMTLTAGIALGGHWAYRELGWGGYWAWDPVENASFMPWLIGTALLHSFMVQEQRKTFRHWNLALAITAFALSILGTFLVRSGIISSVHAFANDPSRGLYLLGFFFTILAGSFGLLVLRSGRLSVGTQPPEFWSRETLFVVNNWVFLVATLTVFLGTLYPLAMDLFTGTKVTVAAPFFNKTFVPIMLVNLAVMAVAPFVPWRRFTVAQMRRVALAPAVLSTIVMGILVIVGLRRPLPVIAVGLIVFAGALLAREWMHGGLLVRIRNNRRRLGGLVSHAGILVLGIGFIGSWAYQSEADVALQRGEKTRIAGYEVRYHGVEETRGPNWTGWKGHFEIVAADGKSLGRLEPQKRIYSRADMPTTEPARLRTGLSEVYVSMGQVDAATNTVTVKVFYNPLVYLVWLGVDLLIAGGLLSLSHRIRSRRTV